jgi:hypothetical protein
MMAGAVNDRRARYEGACNAGRAANLA